MGSHYREGSVRGFAYGSPAVIESSTPMGSPASRCGYGVWVIFCRKGCPLRRDAIHRVSPARGAAPPRHSSTAAGRPGGERRDESRLYVADILCPALPSMIARHNCFLTRRIDYFRATAPSLANTRKSETLDSEDYLRDAPLRRYYKLRISPLYGTFRGDFSIGNRPWMTKSIPWKQKSMGCFGRNIPWIGWAAAWTHGKNAGMSVGAGVRFNGLPYSAQPRAGLRGGRRQKGKSRGSRATMAAPMSSWSGRPTFR